MAETLGDAGLVGGWTMGGVLGLGEIVMVVGLSRLNVVVTMVGSSGASSFDEASILSEAPEDSDGTEKSEVISVGAE